MSEPLNNSSNPKSQPKKRKRSMVSLACESCRSSHFKCDGETPCANCKKRNYECIYSESKRRGRKPNSKDKQDVELKKVKKELITLKNERDYLKEKILSQGTTLKGEEFGQKTLENRNIHPFIFTPNIGSYYHIPPFPQEKLYSSLLFSSEKVDHILDQYIGAYAEYTHFLFPYIEIPDGSAASKLISDFTVFSTKQKLESIIINSILSIGALILKNRNHSEEFAIIANKLAKDVAFDELCHLTAKSFSILAYLSLCRNEIEKADMYNNYALSIYNRLPDVNSQIKATILLNRVLINKKDRVKRLLKIKNELLGTKKVSSLVILFLTFYDETKDAETYNVELENCLNSFKDKHDLMFLIIECIVKAYENMKLKKTKQAITYALKSIEYIQENKTKFQKFPYHFIKILSKLCGLFIDCNKIEYVDSVIECIRLLPWEAPREVTIQHIMVKVRSLRTLHSNFKVDIPMTPYFFHNHVSSAFYKSVPVQIIHSTSISSSQPN